MQLSAALLVAALVPGASAVAAPWAEIKESVDEMQRENTIPDSMSTSCVVTDTESCDLADMTVDQSHMVYPGGETRCIFDSAISGDFAFQVVPGSAEDKVLLFFQGGGACWDEISTYAGGCTTTASAGSLTGLFDHTNDENPYKEYTVVHVLYCSGDVHAGNVTRPYNDADGNPVTQKGYANTMAVLDWMKHNFDFPLTDLVVSGCSAGSLGTQAWAQYVLENFSYEHGTVIADSYAGVFPDGIQGPLVYDFGLCGLDILDSSLEDSCNAQTLTIQSNYESAMAANPDRAFANVNSKADSVQRLFYSALATTEDVPPFTISEAEYENELNIILERYNKQDNYVSFLVTSDQHCYYPSSYTYTADTSGKRGGGAGGQTTLVDWTTGFPVLSGKSVATECDGDVLDQDEWTGSEYCDAAQQGKVFTAP